MKRYRFIFLLLLSSGIFLFACQHKAEAPAPATGTGSNGGGNNGGGNNGGGSGADTSLCFERDILPIFISNCAKSGCHDAASRQEGYVFDSWEHITAKKFKAGDAEDCELYEKITEHNQEIMPPPPNPPLSAQQIALIRTWINSGAPNSTNCGSGNCDSSRFAFAADIKPILDNNCKGCHNSGLASGGFSYENYAGVAAAVNSGRFLGAVKHEPGFTAMPQGGAKLSDCQILKIEKWIAAGMPDN